MGIIDRFRWKGETKTSVSEKSDGGVTMRCDVCSEPIKRETGYILTTEEVIASEKYIDFYIKHHQKNLPQLKLTNTSARAHTFGTLSDFLEGIGWYAVIASTCSKLIRKMHKRRL